MTFRHLRNLLLIALLAAVVAGCSSTGGRKRGGYYKDDGPGSNPPSNLDAIPDAEPRIEPLASGANRPYVVFGKRYVPDTSDRPFTQRGIASWYGKKFHGNATSIGEPYDMYAMTAAHPTMPIPSYARVTSAINGRTVIVRVNDRGPFHDNRIMDLSYAAAYKLGIIGPGSGEVTVQRILPDEIRRMVAQRNSGQATASSAGSAAASPVAAAVSAAPAPVSFTTAESGTPQALPIASSSEANARQAALNGFPTADGGAPSGPTPLPPPPQAQSLPAASPVAEASATATPLPQAAASRAMPAATGNGSVYLQLGAFSQPANAQSLAARVNGQLGAVGLPPATVEQSGQLYRVRVGPYADRNAAMSAVQTVADRTGILPSIATH
ncbi:septal ring lytic transglycosylase RlpA family protein [Bordetella genomosp. 9]|uniref:Endolytic peptidoglycan transglycosylase RlpA n=1 Tax=Bordetella genomosp. 9 TaxID=1416803 RepID=A0A1W6YVD3_9BORD|nr:septal ring lytic transglycosylase RlpA family protein [Bordetella genomosp. 9]ARP84971.1 septal ring lytic transglycosylase RlpA family lipoprotein [Bordetella genomosp. 9]